MKSKLEQIEKNIVQLEIEIEESEFKKSLNKAYAKNKNRFAVPGFRKGKAPRHIVERFYGEQILYEDAIDDAFPAAYDEAVKEHELQPVSRPEIDIKQIGKGKNLIFTAKVTVQPEVTLGKYKGIKVEKVEIAVTDEEVDNALKSTAERNSRLVVVEDRSVKDGDNLTIDFEGSIDGELFEGGTATDYSLVIGSNSFIPGFEDQLIGVELGSDVEVTVPFPEDYHQAELAGKPALFKVKVKDIKEKDIPEIDDEFAQDVSEFDTLDEYKADIRKGLEEKALEDSKKKYENAVIEKIVENAEVEVPEVMVDNQVENYIRDMEMRMKYQGMELAQYLQMVGQTVDDMKAQYRDSAATSVKTNLVISQIVKEEDIDVTEEQVDVEIEKYAESAKKDPVEYKEQMGEDYINYIKDNLKYQNAIDMVVKESIAK